MIVTGKHLPRRTFLKGLGAAVALPMLDAMTPAFAAPALKQAPTRLAFTYIPNGVRLTAYGGESTDLPDAVLQSYLDKIAAGKLTFAPARVYTLDEIRQAHDDMEHDRVAGKMVVRLS